jgi:positive regulator of sigma E activity
MKLDCKIPSVVSNRKISVIIGFAVTLLVIIDLLVTSQILPYISDTEMVIFILTILVGYGLDSWVLLGYTKRISKEIRAKSSFINSMHWSTV